MPKLPFISLIMLMFESKYPLPVFKTMFGPAAVINKVVFPPSLPKQKQKILDALHNLNTTKALASYPSFHILS